MAIARALSMNVRILLMDEPTTNSLSQANVETLFTVVDGLRRDGVSTVYVSHKMEEVQRLCDGSPSSATVRKSPLSRHELRTSESPLRRNNSELRINEDFLTGAAVRHASLAPQ